jgi:hypothetical protein
LGIRARTFLGVIFKPNVPKHRERCAVWID